MQPYDTGPKGIALIKEFEGFSAIPYQCPAGIWTIGYGATKDREGNPVTINHPDVTDKQATELLKKDIIEAEKAVKDLTSTPLCQFQFDALVSFCYNLGYGSYESSTLRKVVNNRDFDKASDEFARWIYASGKPLNGLIKRRAAEAALFMHEPSASEDV
jgi:lysozyme|tara:strand:- start:1187 stop:1663 length:477 start_codon:yes stop_codon:yes gene_type:complete